jgi:uncharacterized protein (DUF1778 family)
MASPARTEKLDLRLSPAAKRALQEAARSQNRSVSEFVLESALARAEEMLPPTRIVLNAEQWDAFVAMLDAPPRDLPKLRELMQQPSVFEQDEG